MMNFSRKVVIVTGSSSGIGEGTAILFAKLGAHVVVTGRNRDNVERVAKICHTSSLNGLKPLEVIADITNDDEAKKLIESTVNEFGKIDVLVHNAGAVWLTNMKDDTLMDKYEKTMSLDLRAIVYLTQLALPYLEISKGNIVSISSVGGLRPLDNMMPYCMAKCALDMYTKCLAIELGPKGIRVNGLNVGLVMTNIQATMGIKDANWARLGQSASPLGIFGYPHDIANCVAFLASDLASFVSGASLVVDSGLSLCNIDWSLCAD